MTRQRIAVVGLVGFTLLAAAIASGTSAGKAGPPGPQDKEVRDYLSGTGPLYQWEDKIGRAVCNLEKYTTGLPQAGDRYCPDGTYPPSGTPPPKFPPG
jgi:hypothetical protein